MADIFKSNHDADLELALTKRAEAKEHRLGPWSWFLAAGGTQAMRQTTCKVCGGFVHVSWGQGLEVYEHLVDTLCTPVERTCSPMPNRADEIARQVAEAMQLDPDITVADIHAALDRRFPGAA